MDLGILLEVHLHYCMSTVFIKFSKKPDFCIKRITKGQSVITKCKTVLGHENVDTIPLFSDNLWAIKTSNRNIAVYVL